MYINIPKIVIQLFSFSKKKFPKLYDWSRRWSQKALKWRLPRITPDPSIESATLHGDVLCLVGCMRWKLLLPIPEFPRLSPSQAYHATPGWVPHKLSSKTWMSPFQAVVYEYHLRADSPTSCRLRISPPGWFPHKLSSKNTTSCLTLQLWLLYTEPCSRYNYFLLLYIILYYS